MKNFTRITIVFAFVAFVASSCGKYEDGPSFSLVPKASRLANIWKIEKVYKNDAQVALTTDESNSYVEFTEDGKVTQTLAISNQSLSITGTWEFDKKKENIITKFNDNGSLTIQTSKILRLASDELWVEITDGSDKTEYHYISK